MILPVFRCRRLQLARSGKRPGSPIQMPLFNPSDAHIVVTGGINRILTEVVAVHDDGLIQTTDRLQQVAHVVIDPLQAGLIPKGFVVVIHGFAILAGPGQSLPEIGMGFGKGRSHAQGVAEMCDGLIHTNRRR